VPGDYERKAKQNDPESEQNSLDQAKVREHLQLLLRKECSTKHDTRCTPECMTTPHRWSPLVMNLSELFEFGSILDTAEGYRPR
jgi:hypothetical protein